MKIRQGFVSNSSSSSFICVTLDNETIYGGDYEPDFETSNCTLNIDFLIEKLLKAKEKGVKTINIEYGGGYDG